MMKVYLLSGNSHESHYNNC